MFGIKRRAHPDADHAPADGLIAAIDAQLRAIAEVPPPERTERQWDYLDRLLDARSAPATGQPLIRPAVPVIPGHDGERRPS